MPKPPTSAQLEPIEFPDGGSMGFERVRVMGVLNVTPDSFSDGGRYLDPAVAAAHAKALEEAGAHILDVGGESTRPGSDPVPADEQIARVVPVIEGVRQTSSIPISIDTTSAQVAAAALDAGASLINDISACTFDPDMPKLVAERGVPVVLMHTSGRPKVMQEKTHYRDVCREVLESLVGHRERLIQEGVAGHQIIFDPGIGFGKTVAQNVALLRDLPQLAATGQPILVGTSRKSFLGALTGKEVTERLEATAASVVASVVLGAHIVRVHDVAELTDTLIVADAIAHAGLE